MSGRFLQKQAMVEPTIYLGLSDSWIKITLRENIDAKERVTIKGRLNYDYLQQVKTEEQRNALYRKLNDLFEAQGEVWDSLSREQKEKLGAAWKLAEKEGLSEEEYIEMWRKARNKEK